MEEEGEEEMESEYTKPSRKRSESYNISSSSTNTSSSHQEHSIINLAETKREIGNNNNNNNNTSNASIYENNYCHNMPILFSDAQYYCYSLLEAMPLPEPIWSTTEPCVMAEPPPPPPPLEAAINEGCLELEWGESEGSSSYSWWVGFLQSLDGEKIMKCPIVENDVVVMEDCCDEDVIDQTCCFDDWLKKDLGDLAMP